MAYSQKYTIVQFLEPIQEGQVFSMDEWPLHITLADVFAIGLNQTLLEVLARFLRSKQRFSVEAKVDASFGEDKNIISVTLLKNTVELQLLHAGLVKLLEVHGAVFNSPQFTNEGFIPHSTHQNHARLTTGQQVNIDQLSLVDMFANGNWQERKVLKSLKLGP